MAWRNVWRNTRRSSVTIAAMTLALCVELLYSGLVTGYLQGMEDDVLDLEVGDMQIFAGDYVDKPSMYTTIKNPDALPLVLPGIEVQGVGEVGLPIGPAAARQLIQQAVPAPYGRGEETIVDPEVRRGWQIEPKHCAICHPLPPPSPVLQKPTVYPQHLFSWPNFAQRLVPLQTKR